MDKNCNHEERENMPLPQKNVGKDFAEFLTKNKDLITRIARSNTTKNDANVTVIPKDDPWHDGHEWDDRTTCIYFPLQLFMDSSRYYWSYCFSFPMA